jgi:hypothetical protein
VQRPLRTRTVKWDVSARILMPRHASARLELLERREILFEVLHVVCVVPDLTSLQQAVELEPRELEQLARLIVREKLLDMMLDDVVPPDKGKPEMKALEERRLELEAQLKAADEPPPLLHPVIADLYHSKVEALADALQRKDTRLEASEMLRGLIDSIVLVPEASRARTRATSPSPQPSPRKRGEGAFPRTRTLIRERDEGILGDSGSS